MIGERWSCAIWLEERGDVVAVGRRVLIYKYSWLFSIRIWSCVVLLTSIQLYSLVLKSLANTEAGGSRLFGGRQIVTYLFMISKLDLRKSGCTTHAEGVLEFGGRARHVVVGRVAHVRDRLLAERGAPGMTYDAHASLLR